jgi:hypothetical protein
MKNIQIPYELFISLVRYHLFNDVDNVGRIKQGLEKKVDDLAKRELYTKSKTAFTEEEREQARKEYLDRKGVPDSFRW